MLRDYMRGSVFEYFTCIRCENCGVIRSLVNAKHPMINTELKFGYDLTNIKCSMN